jgi:RHS repeat-associated protein
MQIGARSLNSQPSTLNRLNSVWDGDWAILEEYDASGNLVEGYVQGYHGLVKTMVSNVYYYQDELGSTSHVANAAGELVEYYKYDLYGKPQYFNAQGVQLIASAYNVRDLHGGARYVAEVGLYDDRNRFMSPDLGRFLQPDPIGFKGDASNLYRYVGNDWANRTDPMGLDSISEVQQRTRNAGDQNKLTSPDNKQVDKEYEKAVERFQARDVEGERAHYKKEGMQYLGLDKNIDRMINGVQNPSKQFQNISLLKQSLTKVINAYLAHKIQMGTQKMFSSPNTRNAILASNHKDKIFVNPSKATHAGFDRVAVDLAHEGTHMVEGHQGYRESDELTAFGVGKDLGQNGLDRRVPMQKPGDVHTEYLLPP